MKTIALALALLAGCLTDPADETAVELDSAELEGTELEATDCAEPALGDATPFYGSTYASNCYCTFCNKYCTVDGTTYKSGSCC